MCNSHVQHSYHECVCQPIDGQCSGRLTITNNPRLTQIQKKWQNPLWTQAAASRRTQPQEARESWPTPRHALPTLPSTGGGGRRDPALCPGGRERLCRCTPGGEEAALQAQHPQCAACTGREPALPYKPRGGPTASTLQSRLGSGTRPFRESRAASETPAPPRQDPEGARAGLRASARQRAPLCSQRPARGKRLRPSATKAVHRALPSRSGLTSGLPCMAAPDGAENCGSAKPSTLEQETTPSGTPPPRSRGSQQQPPTPYQAPSQALGEAGPARASQATTLGPRGTHPRPSWACLGGEERGEPQGHKTQP